MKLSQVGLGVALALAMPSTAFAATVVQNVTTGAADFNDPITFNGFNAALGTLTSVTLDYSMSGTGSAFDSAGLCTSIGDCEGDFVLSLDGSSAFAGLSNEDRVFVDNPEVDAGVTVPLSISGSSISFDPLNFIGATIGTLTPSLRAEGDLANDNFGGLDFSDQSGSYTLTYEFTEASTSTPEPTALLGLGILGVMGVAKRLSSRR